MFNFSEALAEYLQLYGAVVRNGELKFRDIQWDLNQLADVIRDQDAETLAAEVQDLKEWAKELGVVS